jgi:hypothetical protein
MRFKLVSDNDGHDYVIHVEEENAFYSWVEYMEGDEDAYGGKGFDDCRVNCSNLTFTDPQGWQ